MAVIPNANSIQRAQITPTEQIQKLDVSNAGKKSEIYANALSGVAEDVEKIYQIDADFQLSNAEADIIPVFEDVKKKAFLDPEFSTLEERTNKQIAEEESRVLSGIKNNLAKKRFEASQEKRKLQFGSQLSDIIWDKEKSHYRSSFQSKLDGLKSTVGTADIADLSTTAESLGTDYVNKRYFEPEEMQKEISNWKTGTFLAGIDLLPNPEDKVKALSEGWVIGNIDEEKRADALVKATKEVKEKVINEKSVVLGMSKTSEEVLRGALQHENIDEVPELYKKSMEFHKNKKEIDEEQYKATYEPLAKSIQNAASGSEVMQVLNSQEARKLPSEHYEKLKHIAALRQEGVQKSDTGELTRARELVASRRYDDASGFIQGNYLISESDKAILMKDIVNGRVPAAIKYDKILDSRIGVVGKTLAAKNRRERQVEHLQNFEDSFIEANGRAPSKEEVEKEIIFISGEFIPDDSYLPDFFASKPVSDVSVSEMSALSEKNRKKELSAQFPGYYERVKKTYGAEFDGMSSYKIQDAIETATQKDVIQKTDPELYGATIELLNLTGRHEDKDFFRAYNHLKTRRIQQGE